MEDKKNSPAAQLTRRRLILTLTVVFVICGGNGASMIIACILYKAVGSASLAITFAVLLTLLAFAAGMLIFWGGRQVLFPPQFSEALKNSEKSPHE